MDAVKKQRTQYWITVVLGYLAFVYAIAGFANQNYFHWTTSFWLSGYSEKIVIITFGVWRIATEKNAYTRRRLFVLVALIALLWVAFPYFSGSSFFNHHVVGSLWFFIYLGLIFLFGRRMDCAWNCPCVGIRDTAGDVWRGKTLKSDFWWKLRHVKWVFLTSIIIDLILIVGFPRLPFARIYSFYFMLITTGMYFASLLVIPLTGNRNYCRYFCPWGTLYGVLSQWGFYKIAADAEKCIDCGACEKQCDMGVPIRVLIHEKGEINVPDCVGCGRCIQACTRDVLCFVDVRDYLKKRA